MMTLFAIPKAFGSSFGVIQRNAIKSWTLLEPRPQIILAGDDAGTAEAAREFGVLHLPHIRRNDYGTPLLDDVLSKVKEAANYPTLCFVNADMLLLSDFTDAVRRVLKTKKKFLLTGRRLNVSASRALDFGKHWEEDLRAYAKTSGEWYTEAGMDYFVFPSDLWKQIPPFAVGWPRYDNWLLYDAFVRKVCVIDATPAVMAIHQNHTYDCTKGLRAESRVWEGPEADENLRLAGGFCHVFTLDDATHKLTPSGLKPILTLKRLRRYIQTLPAILFGHRDTAILKFFSASFSD